MAEATNPIVQAVPDATEQMWASLLAQVDAEPDLVTRGDDAPCEVELKVIHEPSAEITGRRALILCTGEGDDR